MLRVAVVGSGPAGVYAAGALAGHGGVLVDVLDRLPCPFGLVRYGVAPDHPKIKSISSTLAGLLADPAVRFLGNVEVGRQLTVAELHRFYDALVFTYGAAVDRRLGIPGEQLPGSASATDFVAWYCGHPDAPPGGFTLDARQVAVIGVGNVALDVTRVLARQAEELRGTDVPEPVLAALAASRVERIVLIGRRGPAQARFTTPELRELGELAGADVIVDPAELELDGPDLERVAATPVLRRNLEVLRGWAQREPAGRPRRVELRFRLRPVELLGPDQVTGVRLERTQVGPDGTATGTGALVTVPAGLVLRSVGYRGLPVPGLPFDAEAGVVPNLAGRVLRDGEPVPGEYVAGWIKRGPTGVIGTNKHDARETVDSLLADLPDLPRAPEPDPEAVVGLLAGRGVQVVDWPGWLAIEQAELARGRTCGRPRIKITDRAELLRAAAGAVRAR